MNDKIALNSVLCPVDFSEESRHALRWAQALTGRTAGRLTVLNVVDPLLAEAAKVRLGIDLAQAETEPALSEFVATAWGDDLSSGAVDVVLDVRVGKPADVIVETAALMNADLIVMGTHGLGGIRKWVLGSTTERVLRQTRTAMLAVPPPATTTTGPKALKGQPFLVATDFSDTATRALQWAASVAQELGNPLVLVHVIEPIVVPSRWQAYVEAPTDALVADSRARLQDLVKRFTSSTVSDCLVQVGSPAEMIATVADARRAAVIVMGLASSQGLLGARPGSIAYRVLGLSKIPVIVVPPQYRVTAGVALNARQVRE